MMKYFKFDEFDEHVLFYAIRKKYLSLKYFSTQQKKKKGQEAHLQIYTQN